MQVEAFLEEMLLLCSRSEEYNLWILQSLAGSHESELVAASSEQEKVFRSGPFNVSLRQLIAYYINMVGRFSHPALSQHACNSMRLPLLSWSCCRPPLRKPSSM